MFIPGISSQYFPKYFPAHVQLYVDADKRTQVPPLKQAFFTVLQGSWSASTLARHIKAIRCEE